jgi:hypothetical protein
MDEVHGKCVSFVKSHLFWDGVREINQLAH